MRTIRNRLFLTVAFVILGLLYFVAPQVSAQTPRGVMKGALHFSSLLKNSVFGCF